MRSSVILGLALLMAGVTAMPLRAQEARSCDVPESLLATDSSLVRVADVVKTGRPLEILVVGSRSSTIQVKKTAEEVAGGLSKLAEAKKPTLVIWQTGTVDAMRSVDPDDFRGAVDEGVTALQNAGADVILINPQYSPRTETMISVPPYLDNMRLVAQQHEIPLFDRFAIMHQWNDQGDFDLFSAAHGIDLAKRVHDCLGRALSRFVIDAAHIGPAQQN
jgi:hypothetical protein